MGEGGIEMDVSGGDEQQSPGAGWNERCFENRCYDVCVWHSFSQMRSHRSGRAGLWADVQ